MTKPNTRRTVKAFLDTIQAKIDRSEKFMEQLSSELNVKQARVSILAGLRQDSKNKHQLADEESETAYSALKEERANLDGLRDLYKELTEPKSSDE